MTGVPLDSPPPRPRAASLSCASCGAAISPRAQGWAVTIVCDSCGSVLDATDDNLHVLQQQDARMRVKPRIPLGTRGTWHGTQWEVIGFQVVTITVDGTDYSWTEYVAFNPYRGFLYLSEYQGHWNVIEKLRHRPSEESSGRKPTATVDGRTFTHFQTASARTTLALGEFPWELRVGDAVISRDFVAPPYILSAEASDGETTWSMGTYTPPEVIAKAFNLKDSMLTPIGVFANQPNPYDGIAGKVGRQLGVFLLILAAMFIGNIGLSSRADVYANRYTFAKGTDDSAAFVTPAFELKGRPSSVDIDIQTSLDNDWVFFSFVLINEQSGESRELSQQVSYYHGTDSDGSWTEGSRNEHVRVSSVPSGRYFLRIAPEGGEAGKGSIPYAIRVRRDIPSFFFYVLALAALLIPAVFAVIPKSAFETKRWQESDYAVESSSDSSDEDDE